MIALIDEPSRALAMGVAGRAYVEVAHRVEVQVANLQRILEHAVHRT
jgi:hypothetical protein